MFRRLTNLFSRNSKEGTHQSMTKSQTFLISFENFVAAFPDCRNPQLWHRILNEEMVENGLQDRRDVAMFLAQCAHESSYFNLLEENLNYSVKGLMTVFPRRFPTRELAERYARNPQRIANFVYGNRFGNGPEESGDGWKYRGRGIIMVTFKNNYAECSRYMFNNPNVLVSNPDLLLIEENAAKSAFWFWNTRNLKGNFDIRAVTRIINGGENGLRHRQVLYERLLGLV